MRNDENVIYVDTDSVYLSVHKQLTNLNKLNDLEFCKKYTSEFCKDMVEEINEYYDEMCKDIFNVEEHYLNIEADACASTAIWIKKKKYAMNLFVELSKNKWYETPKLKVLGLDTVRSSFPKLFQGLMDKLLKKILSKEPNSSVNALIEEYENLVKDCEYVDIARNTSIKEISKYEEKNRIPFVTPHVSGAPAHVKASIAFNDYLKYHKLESNHEFISDGEKVKYTYLKSNQYKIEAIAFRNDGKDPKMLLDFISSHIDRRKCFETEMDNKIDSFYNALGWKLKGKNDDNFDEFFA
jgi:DNA polymerase elongation subunit (family B)